MVDSPIGLFKTVVPPSIDARKGKNQWVTWKRMDQPRTLGITLILKHD